MIKVIAIFICILPLTNLFASISSRDTSSRLISLDPGSQKWLEALGLHQNIVGYSSYHQRKPNKMAAKIGRYQKLNWELILKLNPSHVISMDIKNDEVQQRLKSWKIKYIQLKSERLSDFYSNIAALNADFSLNVQSHKKMTQDWKNTLRQLQKLNLQKKYIFTLDLNPFYIAGNHTYISEALKLCGLNNISTKSSYTKFNLEKLLQNELDFIFIQGQILQTHKVAEVNKYFSRVKASYAKKVIILPKDNLTLFHPGLLKEVQKFCNSLKTPKT